MFPALTGPAGAMRATDVPPETFVLLPVVMSPVLIEPPMIVTLVRPDEAALELPVVMVPVLTLPTDDNCTSVKPTADPVVMFPVIIDAGGVPSFRMYTPASLLPLPVTTEPV